MLGYKSSFTGKESTCHAGDLGSIPGLGRFPGEGKGCPLQHSGLENSRDCVVRGVTESDTTEWLTFSREHGPAAARSPHTLCEGLSSPGPAGGPGGLQGYKAPQDGFRHSPCLRHIKPPSPGCLHQAFHLCQYISCPGMCHIKEGYQERRCGEFPDGPVVKKPLSNSGDMGSIPGQGIKIPHALGQLLSLLTATESPCAKTKTNRAKKKV